MDVNAGRLFIKQHASKQIQNFRQRQSRETGSSQARHRQDISGRNKTWSGKRKRSQNQIINTVHERLGNVRHGTPCILRNIYE